MFIIAVVFVDVSACVSLVLPVTCVCFCYGGSSSVCDFFLLPRLLDCVFFNSTSEASIEESCKEDEEGDEDEGDALTSKRVRTL